MQYKITPRGGDELAASLRLTSFTSCFGRRYACIGMVLLRIEELTMSESVKDGGSSVPQPRDDAADHVEKKPREKESSQQQHDDESQG